MSLKRILRNGHPRKSRPAKRERPMISSQIFYQKVTSKKKPQSTKVRTRRLVCQLRLRIFLMITL